MNLRFRLLGLSHATKIALSIVLMIVLLLAGLGIEYWMITNTVRHSDAQWCDTLSLLTENRVPKPDDPAANPSRQNQYLLYVNLIKLKDRFSCKQGES